MTASVSLRFISASFSMGVLACASSEAARPSQKKLVPHARFRSDGALRAKGVFCEPTAFGSGTFHPKDGLWQLAQFMFWLPDRRGSKNNALPSAAFSAL